MGSSYCADQAGRVKKSRKTRFSRLTGERHGLRLRTVITYKSNVVTAGLGSIFGCHRSIGRFACLSVLLTAFVWSSLAVPAALAGGGLKAKGSLSSTGEEAAASGSYVAVMKAKESKFQVKAKRLSPVADYELLVGGELRASARANGGGNVKFKLQSSQTEGLGFDPRGAEVEVRSASGAVLDGVFAAAGEPSDTKYDERADLVGTALAPGAEGKVRYRIKKGQASFECEVEDAPDGTYDVVVGGVVEMTLVVAGGDGEVEIEDGLSFDPRGKTVDIAQGSDVYLTGVARAPAGGIDECEETENRQELGAAAGYPASSGYLEYEIDDDCDPGFEVEIEDLPPGSYEVQINGISRGTIEVVSTLDGNEGELEFGDDDGGPALDFEPIGATVVILEGGTTLWSTTFVGGGTTPPTGSCDDFEVTRSLIRTGVDPSVKGEGRHRRDDDCDEDFQVEIEDGALGTHTVWIDGVQKAAFDVVLVDGEPEGEVEFDDEPQAGEFPLDFDPAGKLIEVRNAGGLVILEYSWPAN